MSEPFIVIEPEGPRVPMILSVPHCGTDFPEEIKDHYKPELAASPDDTDWFVHRLYDFALSMGITIIHAKYSRWVIDLNRDPESKPLYNDGRIITALTTTTDFLGNPIYASPEFEPDATETERRMELYYRPYHQKIRELLEARKQEFGKALLWDAHSIRRMVPTIRKDAFPDMILGDNDGVTAHPDLIETALSTLQSGEYGVNHNTPFKGGYITRSFGMPEQNIHALQLEMSKVLYMDDAEQNYHEERANNIRTILRTTFESLLNTLQTI